MLKYQFNRKLFLAIILTLVLVKGEVSLADEPKYHEFISRVSNEILKLKKMYPQLVDFSINKNVDIENLKIDYGYHTHQSNHSVGWRSAVPNPDKDGIWFYIDLHDKNSMAQIHTQPITGTPLQFGDRNVCFLILEGAATKPLSDKILSILKQSGAKAIQP